jgi:hypothetical protein
MKNDKIILFNFKVEVICINTFYHFCEHLIGAEYGFTLFSPINDHKGEWAQPDADHPDAGLLTKHVSNSLGLLEKFCIKYLASYIN